ncbi:MAG: hypothetical protein K6B75_08100, partial [Lachnospiraceae bacterium]|nr:hypothetical protein [Lachnospiraceae bacterium]
DTVIYPFPATDADGLRSILESNNKDYRGLMVVSAVRVFMELLNASDEYNEAADNLYNALTDAYGSYTALRNSTGSKGDTVYRLDNLGMFTSENSLTEDGTLYFEDLSANTPEVQKAFFGGSVEITMRHLTEISALIRKLTAELTELNLYVSDYNTALYNDGDQNLLCLMADLAALIAKGGGDTRELAEAADSLSGLYVKTIKLLSKHMHDNLHTYDQERFKKVCLGIAAGDKSATEKKAKKVDESTYRLLKASLKQILDFSHSSEEVRNSITESVENFVNLKDKTSSEDEARLIRRKLQDSFYKVYKDAFLQSLNHEKLPYPVELFLNFGYMDERLVSKETAMDLLAADVSTKAVYNCHIYTLPEWLMAIYSGKREPSKNEFDMEYSEMLRDEVKGGRMSEADAKKMLGDTMAKLEYEIKNFFRLNHRVVSGQPSIFSPIIYEDQITKEAGNALVTKDRMGQTIEKIRTIDYSVFYREMMYNNKELGIEKEYQMLEVVPDVILMPAYGSNSVMWQDISCKRRNSPGRFVFPILCETNLDELVIRALGKFRWELCRTMQGTAWNNITVKSLTSEYSDYLQFYRKNKELSEERKEKIKLQIAKGKNNSREIFVIDYEQWIKSESTGGMRLNKVAREILATYCPFNKEIRTALESQPPFAEAVARFNRETQKKVHEAELHFRAIQQKQQVTLPKELEDTLAFYRDK